LREEVVELRVLLDSMSDLAARIEAGHQQLVPRLANCTAVLCKRFRQHLDHEDALLGELVHDDSGWRALRADRLLCEHRDQRRALRVLREVGHATCNARAARRVRTFVHNLRQDIVRDEHGLSGLRPRSAA
jgi:hypothetical protein